MAGCIGTGLPQFPSALVQMRHSIGENGCGHILMGGNSGGKEREEEKRGKRWGICIRQVAIRVENTNKKKILYIGAILFEF